MAFSSLHLRVYITRGHKVGSQKLFANFLGRLVNQRDSLYLGLCKGGKVLVFIRKHQTGGHWEPLFVEIR